MGRNCWKLKLLEVSEVAEEHTSMFMLCCYVANNNNNNKTIAITIRTIVIF